MRLHRFGLMFVLLATTSAYAEPHFSALFGQSCFLCHANPTGRSMRSLYGSQFFAPTYLPPKALSFELLEKISPQLSESVTIGTDLRTIWMAQDWDQDFNPANEDTAGSGLNAPISTNTGTVAQMEGFLYFNLQATERFSIFYSQGISNSRFEAYGMADVLPYHGFVKAGQFQENYGWSFADHTAFVRTGLLEGWNGGWLASPNPPRYALGAEVGVRPYRFDITGSFTNAQTSFPAPFDTQKRWVARAMYQNGLNNLGLQATAGGSYLHAPYRGTDLFTPQNQVRPGYRAWGGFGGIGWQGIPGMFGGGGGEGGGMGFGFLTTAVLIEYDRKAWSTPNIAWFADPVNNPQFIAVTSAYATGQLNIMLYPGVWVTGMYDWLDNNQYAPGMEAERTSIGLQLFPLPWVDIQPRYRLYSPVDHDNYRHVELQAHFQF